MHERKVAVLTKQDKKMMDQVINWEREIGDIAGPFQPTDTKESWLARAYAAISKKNPNVTYRHLRSLFYGHVRDPKFSVAQSVLSAAEQARIEAAKREASQLATRFEEAAGGLDAKDSDFYRPDVLALLDAARKLRALDRT